MLNIQKISYPNINYINKSNTNPINNKGLDSKPISEKPRFVNTNLIQAYHPSFSKLSDEEKKLKKISSIVDKNSVKLLKNLQEKGILDNNDSNDGSSVLDNLYNIATKQRIKGLNQKVLLEEVIKALDNPYSITQKFGDLPDKEIPKIEQEIGEKITEKSQHVASSCCVVASMEFNLASLKPAEFTRFAENLSSDKYSCQKNLKLSDIFNSSADGICSLNQFNTDYSLDKDWENLSINIKPDRNAIVRARVQTSYKDPNERSCIDVLIQSALLNLGSQHTYNAITDERTGKLNPEKTGLTDEEKNFVEEIVFEKPKISVVYQNINNEGYLVGYNSKPEETKQHILKSLQLGQNVIIGYTHINEKNQIDGGHEITITGYEQDNNGENYFICNDTDDEIDEPIKIKESKLLPLIHHAGISKEALSKDDEVIDTWRVIVNDFQQSLKNK